MTLAASEVEEDTLWDAISNALARLFLDSDQLVQEAVDMWRRLSSHRNVNTDRGRRELAFVLWKTLTKRGVIREKRDLEAVCGAPPNSVKNGQKRKSSQNTPFKRPAAYVDTLGAWLGLPFQDRRIINKYMRSFDLKNDHLSTRSPEVLAGASILFMYDKLRRKFEKSGDIRIGLPNYLKNVTPDSVVDLIVVDRQELKQTYKSLPRNALLEEAVNELRMFKRELREEKKESVRKGNHHRHYGKDSHRGGRPEEKQSGQERQAGQEGHAGQAGQEWQGG